LHPRRSSEIAAGVPPEAGRPPTRGVNAGLIGGALAACASVVCWVVPLVLVSIGVTGAWMSTFTVLAPYKGWLIVTAFGCMGYAGYKIFLGRPAGGSGLACGAPQSNRFARVMFWMISALLLVAVASPYLAPYFFEE
jgi:mercuric ion transport protein